MPFLPKENIYGHTKKLRYFLSEIQRLSAGRSDFVVLDYGCGNGAAVSQYLIQLGIRYYGVDFHPESINYARQHFSTATAQFLEAVPPGVVFDAIVYSDIIEHLSDPAALLSRHRQCLAEDGSIIGSVPNGYGPFENEKRLGKIIGIPLMLSAAVKVKRALVGSSVSSVPYNSDSGHIQFFTRVALTDLLEASGYRLESFANGAFVGAPGSELILRGETVARANTKVADFLPYWAVSTWYFTARRK